MRHLLNRTATVLVESFEADAFNEPVASTTVEAEGLPCLVRPLSAEARADQGRDASTRMSRIYFDLAPFPEDDARTRLIVVDGRTYRPIDALDVNGMGRLWHVDAELVTG